MSHWRSLLQLTAVLAALFFANPDLSAQNGQGIPTPTIYQTANGSYDAMNKYTNMAPVNGLNLGNVSHLGASWSRSLYVDRSDAFGVLAFDNMAVYSNGNPLNGLNGPQGWSGAYVDRVNAFPALTWDDMSVYSPGSTIDPTGTLNGGLNNGSSANWPSGYIDPGAPTGPCSALALDAFGIGGAAHTGINDFSTMGFTFVAGHDAILTAIEFVNQGVTSPPQDLAVSINGNNSTSTSGFIPLDNSTIGQVQQWCPATPFLIKSGVTYTVVCTGNASITRQAVCSASPFVSTMFTAVTDISSFGGGAGFLSGPVNIKYDIGYLWQTNVVANGGAKPGSTSLTAVENFWAGLVADGIASSEYSINVVASDNLTASLTPIIYFKGNQPYINHNFVGGDLGVNGLTGNGTTKFLDTGFNPSTTGSALGLSAYAYTASATGVDLGVSDLTHSFTLLGKFSDNNSYLQDSVSNLHVASPGNGFYSGNRTDATHLTLYFANSGSSWASIGTDSTTFTSYPNLVDFFMAGNANGSAATWSSDTISFCSFHTGFNTSQGQQEFNRVQTMRVAMGGGSR